LEAKIQSAVYDKFVGSRTVIAVVADQLKWADRTMLATEKKELFHDLHPINEGEMNLPQPLRMRIPGYPAQVAYNIFMERYTNLVTDTAN
jgi:hypothetical protein